MIEYSKKDFNTSILGSFYSKEKTVFRVFAPESRDVSLVIHNKRYKMHKRGFYFEVALGGDLKFVRYSYENEDGVRYNDPFAYSFEDKHSIVLDKSRFITEKYIPEDYSSIIIYELNVRDFSCDENYSGMYKRKFLALSEEGLTLDGKSIGVDYLKSLGISHIQLMPVTDFDNDNSDYNWGYNPLAYNCIKRDYLYDTLNPYSCINEFRKVVNYLHQNNLRVTLDVVFNHVYDKDAYDLEKMNPGHTLRRREDGSFAEGSLCGNEIKSEDPFTRAYLIEMVKRYVELYDIDGVRIDQMGILDYETVNELYGELRAIKKDFIVYGEGWNMGDVLPVELRASLDNAPKLPNIFMFNDYYRDVVAKYICGNDQIIEEVKAVLTGNCNNLNYKQSLNYVECHDNVTFFDRLLKYKADDGEEVNAKRCKLAMAMVMFARGVPFFHGGQEFLRTKQMVDNSYNSSEQINKIDWKLRVKNDDIIEYFRNLIRVRKENKEFDDVELTPTFRLFNNCIVYEIDKIMIIINPSGNDFEYSSTYEYKVLCDENGKELEVSKNFPVKAYSLVLAKRV